MLGVRCSHRYAARFDGNPFDGETRAMTVSVYLDHCVVSSICKQPGKNWREVGMGKVLSKSADEGVAEVWTSPTEILEVLLCAKFDDDGKLLDSTADEKKKLDLRISMAKCLLEMTEAKRMAPPYEFFIVEDFMEMLRRVSDDLIYTDMHFNLFRQHSIERFIGLLGLIAGYRHLDRPEAAKSLLRTKITSRLLHSRFACDPDGFVDRVIDCAENYRVTTEDIWKEFDQKPLNRLINEMDQNEAKSVKMDKRTKTKLQKHKGEVARVYGAAELGPALVSVFPNVAYIVSTFNMPAIKKHWAKIVGDPNAHPPACMGPPGEKCPDDLVVQMRALSELFLPVAAKRLAVATIPSQVVLGELELCLPNDTLPTKGLTFDSQHAAMLTRMQVFATQDGKFANLARRAAGLISKDCGWDVSVATDAAALEKQIKKQK